MDNLLIAAGVGGLIGTVIGIVFLMIGAWVHHRGVLLGTNNNTAFIGEAKGDVLRIPMPEDIESIQDQEPGEHEKKVLERSKLFDFSFGGGE